MFSPMWKKATVETHIWPMSIDAASLQGGPILGGRLLPPGADLVITGSNGHPDAVVKMEVRESKDPNGERRWVPECVEVTVRAKPDGRGLLTTDVMSLDDLVRHVFAMVGLSVSEEPGGATRFGPEPMTRAGYQQVKNEIERARKGRPRVVTTTLLKRVAEVYLNAEEDPTGAVARETGVQARTAARYIQRAAEAGLLPTTTKGKRRGK